jgi:hypothetical protein
LLQSPGLGWICDRFPFTKEMATATELLLDPPKRTFKSPLASRNFCVGQRKV